MIRANRNSGDQHDCGQSSFLSLLCSVSEPVRQIRVKTLGGNSGQLMVRIQLTQKQTKAEDRQQKRDGDLREQVESHAGSISVAVLQGDEIVYTFLYLWRSQSRQWDSGRHRDDLPAWLHNKTRHCHCADATGGTGPGEYIPESPERQNVTVRQLLDHSACMGTA